MVHAKKVDGKMNQPPKTFKAIIYTDDKIIKSDWNKSNTLAIPLK